MGPELLIIKTTNGGEDWEEVENNPNFYHFGYSSVFFIDSNIGWIIQYYELGKVLLKTTNGGLLWEPISQGVMLSGYGGGSWYDQGAVKLQPFHQPSYRLLRHASIVE